VKGWIIAQKSRNCQSNCVFQDDSSTTHGHLMQIDVRQLNQRRKSRISSLRCGIRVRLRAARRPHWGLLSLREAVLAFGL
jgi:hypothetical protein